MLPRSAAALVALAAALTLSQAAPAAAPRLSQGALTAQPTPGALTAQPTPGPATAQPTPGPAQPPAPARPPAVPNPAGNSELYGDTCVSSSECWAVGFYVNAAGANMGEALRFTGTTWSRVPVPELGGSAAADYEYLDAVTCPSRSDCFAVGYHGNKAKASVNEILHWDGRRWSAARPPEPGGAKHPSDSNELLGIACAAKTDCWAVGARTNKAGAYVNEALHWNGKQWKIVATPNPTGTGAGEQNVTYSVACSSRSDCLSVGYGLSRNGATVNEALRWNGNRWVNLSVPQPGGRQAHAYAYLQGLTCVSAADCWAAGGYLSDAYQNQLLRWGGKHWTEVAAPNPGGTHGGADNELTALTCSAPTDCWAVGYYYDNTGAQLNQALHWDGTAWSLEATPQPGGSASDQEGNTLYDVSCARSSDCWAVGYTFNTRGPAKNQALLWDGIAWSVG